MKTQAEGAPQDKAPPKLEQGAQLEGEQKLVQKALEGAPKKGVNIALPQPPPEQAVPAAAMPPQPAAGARSDDVDAQKQPDRQPDPQEQDTHKIVKKGQQQQEGARREGQEGGVRREGQEGGVRRDGQEGGVRREGQEGGVRREGQEGQEGGVRRDGQEGGVRRDGQEGGGRRDGQEGGVRREGQEGGVRRDGQEGGVRRDGQEGGVRREGQKEAPAAGIPVQSEEGFDGGLQKEDVDVRVAAVPNDKVGGAKEPEKMETRKEAGKQEEGGNGGALNGEDVRKVRELKAVSKERNAPTAASNR